MAFTIPSNQRTGTQSQFQGVIPYFLDSVLSTPAASIPKGAQWVVVWGNLKNDVLPGITSALALEPRSWQIENAQQAVLDEKFQTIKGCTFAQGISMPGDSLVTNPEGNIMSNALLRSYVGQGRNQFPQLRITFLETNASFSENFLRPWAIATGSWGMFARARGSDKSYRTDLTLYKLGVYNEASPPYIVLKMNFFDICCISVSEEEYNYDPKTTPTRREAQFVYHHYNVDTSAAGPMTQTTP